MAIKTLEELSPAEQRALLKKHKRPLGARCARGRKYLTPQDLERAGAAIEKRARRALKRQASRRTDGQ